jgi:type I restriction enzyme M protein
MTTTELIDKIFKDPNVKYELSEFDSSNINYDTALQLVARPGTGKSTGKTIYYLKTLAPFHSEKEEVQIYVEDGKSNPEEIVRQLWVYKLINYYGYDKEEIELEAPVAFGSDIGTKFIDIVVYTSKEKTTPKIVLEIKKPKRKDGIEQLRSYMGGSFSTIGVWSNGSEKVVLYRPLPRDFDALPEIPRKGQTPDDIQAAKLTLAHLDKSFNFKKILLDLEELVLGSSGVNVFNEIFKIIFAKIWDEKQAIEVRPDQSLEFKWFKDPELTYERINYLFKQAALEWKGVFEETDRIRLQKEHLNVCIAPLERKRFLGSNLRIIDDAFEYLLPTEAKKKKGQFFTPRFVIDMCVRMLNPKRTEYVLDPACGSAGFLVHAMEWAYPVNGADEMELRKSRYAARYLWGIDFEEQAAKTSRALMLIAGDGHTNIFGPDVDTLNPKTWYRNSSGKSLMENLRKYNLNKEKIPNDELFTDDDGAWKYFEELQFDIILSNPPFAGEVKVKEQLAHYQLAKNALKRARDKQAKEERDVLFIERIMKMLKPGGRAAIVLPQGKFNNSSLAFIRDWILRKARLLAVVGLHGNSFKPHTGTKTSVIFIQKYNLEELANIEREQNAVKAACPNYSEQIEKILSDYKEQQDVPEDVIPENILELLLEDFSEVEQEEEGNEKANKENEEISADEEVSKDDEFNLDEPTLEERIEQFDEQINELKSQLVNAKQHLDGLTDTLEATMQTHELETKIIAEQWQGNKKELSEFLKPIKDAFRLQLAELKANQKAKQKELRAEISKLASMIVQFEYDRKLLTNKGKLKLILEDEDKLQKLSDRLIDSEVAKRLDYSIFMAVSEKGGKNNSGEYEYLTDSGNIIEDENGNPMINQDLVNYDIKKEDLHSVALMDEESLGIAETFVKFAKEQGFSFWKD